MAFFSLQEYINYIEKQGQLIRIKEFVDPVYEIAEVTSRIASQKDGKALLFENTGCKFPVFTNIYGSTQRMKNIFGEPPEFLTKKWEQFFHLITEPPNNIKGKISLLKKISKYSRYLPKTKKKQGACQDNIILMPDLNVLPVLKCWPGDGGPFITLPMVHTKDPQTGITNVGMYRMQVFDKTVTGMHWHIHKGGAEHFEKYKKMHKRMPVVVTLGGDPIYAYTATAPLPDNLNEYILAGFLREKKVNLIPCITQDLYVPEDVDIVIEGYVDPDEELIWEGPFGDHTGYYSAPDWYPKFHVTCITHRRDAVYPATVVGIPPQEDRWLIKATQQLFYPLIKKTILPEVKSLEVPEAGVGHNLTIAHINSRYPGHAQKAMHALWGAGQMMLNKILIVANTTAKKIEYKDYLRMICNNANPEKHFHFSTGPLDVLDHAGLDKNFGGKLGIDLTTIVENNDIKSDLPDFSNKLTNISEISGFDDRFIQDNISLLIVYVDDSQNVAFGVLKEKIIDYLKEHSIRFVIVADKLTQECDYYHQLWLMLSNYDPVKDTFVHKKNKDHIVIINCLSPFAGKHRSMLAISSGETTKTIDSKWDHLGLNDLIKSPSGCFNT
jgi:4-hydroxy-3-polyprenylbenzoate decarboxylase